MPHQGATHGHQNTHSPAARPRPRATTYRAMSRSEITCPISPGSRCPPDSSALRSLASEQPSEVSRQTVPTLVAAALVTGASSVHHKSAVPTCGGVPAATLLYTCAHVAGIDRDELDRICILACMSSQFRSRAARRARAMLTCTHKLDVSDFITYDSTGHASFIMSGYENPRRSAGS